MFRCLKRIAKRVKGKILFVWSLVRLKIPSAYREDYEQHWGLLDYTGKVILDVGADYGSSCYYFLQKGARYCIGVDSNEKYIRKMKIYSRLFPIIPVLLDVSASFHFDDLIQKYKPDVMKIDCEGCEVYLLESKLFREVEEYFVEVHVPRLEKKFLQKFERENYEIIGIRHMDGKPCIAARKACQENLKIGKKKILDYK